MRKRHACRLLACSAACVVIVATAACSRGSDDSETEPKASPCPLIAQLDETAASVARADVSDPDAFDRTLRRAVASYVATVRELRRTVPDELHDELERMEAAVNQYRFQDAGDARAALDAYSAANCGPTVTSGASTSIAPTTAPPTTTP